MSPRPEVSVVVPVYNNATTLAQLALLVSQALRPYSYELVFVNDDSPDDSAAVLAKLADEDGRVKVKTLAENQGQNRAIMAGLGIAEGKIVVVMDADLQDQPQHLPALVQQVEKTGEATFLRRQGQYQKGGRMATSRIYKRLLQSMTGLHYQAGSYFSIPATLVPTLLEVPLRHPIVTVMVAVFSPTLHYVPGTRSHNQGISNYTWRGRMRYARRALACARYCRKWKRTFIAKE